MTDTVQELAAIVLAAGSGTRLRPLTDLRPKALCPVNNRPLIDYALESAASLSDDVAVNAWHHADQVMAHLDGRVRVSVEEPHALGTAGALGRLKDWIGGRGAVVHNADAWHQADLRAFAGDWDGQTIRLLVSRDAPRGDFGELRFLGVSLMPWSEIQGLEPVFSGLWEQSWEQAYREDRLEFRVYEGAYFDCGTPRDYLAANLLASGGANVIGEGADVKGAIERCVVWPKARVRADEHLIDVIRAPGDISIYAGEVVNA